MKKINNVLLILVLLFQSFLIPLSVNAQEDNEDDSSESLTITEVSPLEGSYTPGSTVTHTIKVKNEADEALTNIIITFPKPHKDWIFDPIANPVREDNSILCTENPAMTALTCSSFNRASVLDNPNGLNLKFKFLIPPTFCTTSREASTFIYEPSATFRNSLNETLSVTGPEFNTTLTNSICSSGQTCINNTCANPPPPCGDLGQNCCANNMCNGSLLCGADGMCANPPPPCGNLGQNCCADRSCNPYGICSSRNICVPCGMIDRPCCSGNMCNDSLLCTNGICTNPPSCGALGQSCCADRSCNPNGICSSYNICVPCGMIDRPCCPGNSPCESGTSCISNRCTAPTTTSSTIGSTSTTTAMTTPSTTGSTSNTANFNSTDSTSYITSSQSTTTSTGTSTTPATTGASNIITGPCGRPPGPCCAGGGGTCFSLIHNGSTFESICVNNRCAECGRYGQPCCIQDRCVQGVGCQNGTCVPSVPSCGANGQACCNGNTCNNGIPCRNGRCVCGVLGERCCGGGICYDDSYCRNNTCVPTCGADGQLCCSGNTCNSGLTCQVGICASPPPACGGQNQSCCSRGTPCKWGLRCVSGSCRP